MIKTWYNWFQHQIYWLIYSNPIAIKSLISECTVRARPLHPSNGWYIVQLVQQQRGANKHQTAPVVPHQDHMVHWSEMDDQQYGTYWPSMWHAAVGWLDSKGRWNSIDALACWALKGVIITMLCNFRVVSSRLSLSIFSQAKKSEHQS